MTVEEFWRLTPGEALRVVEAYRRRQHDALELAYMQAAIAATWNSEAVWGKRRAPSLESLLASLRRPGSRADGEPSEEMKQQIASFDEEMIKVRMRVLKERQARERENERRARG